MAIMETEARTRVANSPRMRHLRAPRFKAGPDEEIRFNKGLRFGQGLVETFLGTKSDLRVLGSENLYVLRKVLENGEKNPGQRKKVIVTLNHESHLDLPKLVEAMAFGGGDDLRRKLFIFLGDRLTGSLLVDLGSRQYPWIRTPQPYDEKMDGKLTEAQLDQKQAEDHALIRDARSAMNYLFSHDRFGVLVPTGTRKAGHDGIPAVTGYLKGTSILPVHISGTNEILPPGEWRAHKGTVTVRFGEMYSFSEIEQSCQELPRDQQRKAQIDMVMGRIYALAPTV